MLSLSPSPPPPFSPALSLSERIVRYLLFIMDFNYYYFRMPWQAIQSLSCYCVKPMDPFAFYTTLFFIHSHICISIIAVCTPHNKCYNIPRNMRWHIFISINITWAFLSSISFTMNEWHIEFNAFTYLCFQLTRRLLSKRTISIEKVNPLNFVI